MKINISETATVLPSHPPFTTNHTLPYSHLDTDRNHHVIFRYLRVYAAATTTAADPFHVITTSLSAALVHYYPYTGTLRHCENGRFELNCTVGKGVPVIRATSDCTLTSVDYLDDPAANYIENLVPDPSPEEGMAHPLMLHVTVFGCGGYTMGVSIHHAMNDGFGGSLFYNTMAGLARGETKLPVEPVWDRARLLGPRNPVRVEFPFHEYLCLDKEFSAYSQLNGPVVRACFPVKEEWLDRFKGYLRERSGLNFTTFEAFGAFIWQSRYAFLAPLVDF